MTYYSAKIQPNKFKLKCILKDIMSKQYPVLEKLHIYLTDKCNQLCRHCWVNASPKKNSCLEAEQVKKQIDKAMLLGLRIVKITGGEPLLFQGILFDILECASNKKLETRLETNAILINPQNASRIFDLGVIVYPSLDGSYPGSHDIFRNKKGSFNQTLAGIEMLTAQGVMVEVISCIHPNNLSEIDSIIDLCISLGVRGLKFNFPSPYGRAILLKQNSNLLTVKQIIETTQYIDKTYHNCGLHIDIDVPRVFRITPNHDPRCNILNIMSILPDGRYSLCGIGVTHKELTFGHLKEDDIDDVWRKSEILKNMRKTIPHSANGVCGICSEYAICHGHCIAYSISELSSLNGPFPLCQDAFKWGLFPKEKLVRQ